MSQSSGTNTATTRSDRAWLDVPYAEKDAAKALGARWDPDARRWYDPCPAAAGLDRWAALPDLPDLLPGEDRTFGSGLFVDLVPSTCWITNVRSCVIPRDWDRIRRMVTRRAGHACEACGAGEDRARHRWLEVHERWHYDSRQSIQSLRRLVCLCSECHRVTHFSLTVLNGNSGTALTHLLVVTGMGDAQARRNITLAIDLWKARSRRFWTLDTSMLTRAGIQLISESGPST